LFQFQNLIAELAVLALPILAAVTFHELAHGWVAYRLGDPTAKMLGRLTLNPFAHLDPFGTLAFVLTRAIGWAKPVPVNPRYFRNPHRDLIWVSLAGPAANFLLAAVFAAVFGFLLRGGGAMLGQYATPVMLMAQAGVTINIGLAVFNLVPVPPLDGSKVLQGLLPLPQALAFGRLEPYGIMILLLLIFSGLIGRVVIPPVKMLVGLYLSLAI
jgi:Zn-dependent protease